MKDIPAFPDFIKDGMTLHDYFAANAMQGMFASGNLRRSIENDEVAEVAYRMADAMMKARNNE